MDAGSMGPACDATKLLLAVGGVALDDLTTWVSLPHYGRPSNDLHHVTVVGTDPHTSLKPGHNATTIVFVEHTDLQ